MEEMCTRGTTIGVDGKYLRSIFLSSQYQKRLGIVLVYEEDKFIGFLLFAQILNSKNERMIEIKAVCKGANVDRTRPIFPAMLGIVAKYAEQNNANLQLYASTVESARIYTRYNFSLTNKDDPSAVGTYANSFDSNNGYFMMDKQRTAHAAAIAKLSEQDGRDTVQIVKEITMKKLKRLTNAVGIR